MAEDALRERVVGHLSRDELRYEPIRIDYDLPNVLRLWVKVHGMGRSNRWPL